MKKLLLLLILSLFSAESFAGSCPDGSEPVKSVSSDGSYFVYNCGGQSSSSSATNSMSGTVKVAMKPFSGDWLNESIFPLSLKKKIAYKYVHNIMFAMGDFDNDGVDDYFHLGKIKTPHVISGSENPEITNSTACSIDKHGDSCYNAVETAMSVFSIKNNTTNKIWNSMKGKWDYIIGPSGTDVSHLIITNNPKEMNGQEPNRFHLADFNGDGVPDIFVNDTGVQFVVNGKTIRGIKNDLYYLSQPDGAWLESTITHVTGTGVKKGKGLINFTHGASAGDIDGDGDIDVVASSNAWDGNNGKVMCYMNQGGGHMVVRKCGNQWGWEIELGDIDNDGDLDIAFGGSVLASLQKWSDVDGMGGCASYNHCPRAFNGILLNDGTGNFYERGFEFDDVEDSSNGFPYNDVPNISVADLDADGDLDVVRMHVGRLYQGGAMSIEENIGNGQFRTVFLDEWCDGPKSKAVWQMWEGGGEACWASDFLFGDFNKDGLIDIVVNGSDSYSGRADENDIRIPSGTVYLSTGKFKYDIIRPVDDDYPLVDVVVSTAVITPKEFETEVAANAAEKLVEDELAAFEAELAAELAE